MRLVGVDFGGKRIGIAVGESLHCVTSARTALAASGSLAKDAMAIVKLSEFEKADGVVVGIPINEGGSNRMERVCRQLAEKIEEMGTKVFTVSEAFTSRESEQNLGSVYKRGALRNKIDGEAARLILERFFDGQS